MLRAAARKVPTVGTFELFDRGLLALPSAESRLFRAAQGLQIAGPDKSLVSHTIHERSMDFAAGKYGSPDDPYFGEGAPAHRDGFHGGRVGILALALRRQIAARSASSPNGRTAKVRRKSHKTSLIDAAIRGSKCSRCWNICTFRRLRDRGGIWALALWRADCGQERKGSKWAEG